MVLDVYRREDILNVLRAVALAGSQGEAGHEFHKGFEAALQAIGAAFGIHIEPGAYIRLVSGGNDGVCSGQCETCPNRQQLPG